MSKKLKIKKEYISYTTNLLKMYLPLKKSVDLMIEDIKLLEDERGSISGIDYKNDRLSKTYKINSIVENEAIHRIDRINLLNEKIDLANHNIEKTEEALKVLEDKEKDLIEAKYMKSNTLSWEDVSDLVGYSVDYCKGKLRTSAVEKIALAFYGIDSLQEKHFLCNELN
ncbi:MAG: hypothetical protein N4A57_04820 [Anaeromicrobium sp.]|jgi:hypothetical protein|uniref:hypothetical protein n=1 Tax=Anaeromicrobium sp. TaxID=1929132 RepID=UPI0025E405C6|nr:hypothetical protein [Anaeromicrobium sp.]MCT4593580.1 hypothetical protein [Anaeromicrobium sp.]